MDFVTFVFLTLSQRRESAKKVTWHHFKSFNGFGMQKIQKLVKTAIF